MFILVPLYVTEELNFSLAVFKIFSLLLALSNFIMTCFVVVFYIFLCWGFIELLGSVGL